MGPSLPWLLAALTALLGCGPADRPLFAPAPGSPIAVAGGPGNVALGDLNGDGKLDLVVACGKDKSVTVLLGQGDGRFRPAPAARSSCPTGPAKWSCAT